MNATRYAPDAWDRVTGRAEYAQDVPADALRLALVRSPHPHAEVLSVDATAAAGMPGVAAVLTGEDIGDRRFGRFTRDYPVLALDRVLFAGQPVAAVAAVDVATARRAADSVKVQYRVLEPLLTPVESLAPGAPAIHPGYDGYVNAVQGRRHHNLQGEDAQLTGEPAKAFAECDEVYENEFTWSRSSSSPLESHGALVDASNEKVLVYASHKEPYKLRRDLAALAERPETDFEVRPVKIGGDFGSKGNPFVEGICYFLSLHTGRPVKGRLTFAEGLGGTGGRHGGSLYLRTGLRRGTVHAHESRFVLDGGAFVAPKPMPKGILPMLGLPMGAYSVGHLEESAVGAYTNTMPGSHVRSPGEFQTIFASESHMEMIARERGEDPVEFKVRNLRHGISRRLLERVQKESSDWGRAGTPAGETVLGTGFSVFHRSAGPGESTVRLTATGEELLLEAALPDQGAGSYEAFARLVATRLRVARERVTVRAVGTDSGLIDMGAGASRVTVVVGRACEDACSRLLDELGGVPDRADGISEEFWPGKALAALGVENVSAIGAGAVGRGEVADLGEAHGALAIQLAVDPATGILRVRRAVLAADVGPVLNPVGLRGQLEGGFVFGLSQTLFEDLRQQDGKISLDSLNDYKLASGVDVPELAIHLIEVSPLPDDGLAGVRAVGELVNIGVPAAVANALDDAVGVRLCSLPLTAEKVFDALAAKAAAALAPADGR